MFKSFAALAAATTLASIAVPASAGTVIFTNGGSNYAPSKTFTDGTVNVKVSAFTLNNSSITEAASLASWSGGLGILNAASDGSHTVDNKGYTDFLVLVFDRAVSLGTAAFTTGYAGTDNYTYNDTDATIGFINAAGFDWTSNMSPYLVGASKSTLSSAFSVYASNSVGNGSQSRGINGAGNSANIWLVSSAFTNPDNYYDGFKLKSLTYTVPHTAVPEPSSWALMILGFGLVGGAMRRKRQTAAVTFA